jgi:antitoxin ParD1/3/4
MTSRATLNVSLTPELVEFVQGRVRSGRYQTASEVVREALRVLELREVDRLRTLDAVRENLEDVYRRSMDGNLRDADTALAALRVKHGLPRGSQRTPDG